MSHMLLLGVVGEETQPNASIISAPAALVQQYWMRPLLLVQDNGSLPGLQISIHCSMT